jgi:hypothetical protein
LGCILLLIGVLWELLGIRLRSALSLSVLRIHLHSAVVGSCFLLLVVHAERVAVVHQGGNE